MGEKPDPGWTRMPHEQTRDAVGSRHRPELLGDVVNEETELRLALERWEDEGGS